MQPIDLARVVLRAAEIREKSYDHIALFQEEIVRDHKLRREGKEPENMLFYTDYKRYYGLDLRQSIIKALDEYGLSRDFADPIDYAFHWWNDVIDWAEDQVRKEMWEYKFITRNGKYEEPDDGEPHKNYTIWDETQANELGRYDTWVECVFWLRRYADQLNKCTDY